MSEALSVRLNCSLHLSPTPLTSTHTSRRELNVTNSVFTVGNSRRELLFHMDEERLLTSNPDEEEAGGSTDGDASDLFPEWRERVQSTVWYYASPFAYCVAGGLLVVRPEPLERGLPLFPWRCTGFAVVCNGFMSFMADVEMWGRESRWQTADRVLAIVNTMLQAGVVVMSCMGYSNFPIESPVCLGSGVVLALVCKQRSAAAFRRGDCDAFVRWHSAWHLLLPLGAVAGQLVLHRRCDYELQPPWGAGNCLFQDALAQCGHPGWEDFS